MTLPNKVTYLLIMLYAVYVHVHRQGNSIVYSVILFEITVEWSREKSLSRTIESHAQDPLTLM